MENRHVTVLEMKEYIKDLPDNHIIELGPWEVFKFLLIKMQIIAKNKK